MPTGIVSQIKHNRHACFIALIGFLISLALFYALQFQEERHVLSIAQLGIETIDNNIKAELAFDVHILQHVSAHVNQGNFSTTSGQQNLNHLLASYPRFYGFSLIDTKLHFHNLVSNQAAYVPLFIKFVNDQAQRFHSTPSVWVSSPQILPDKTSAFFMVLPIIKVNHEVAYILTLIKSDSLFLHSGHIPGIFFDVYLNKQPLFQSNPNSDHQSWLFKITQTLYGGSWEIQAQEATVAIGKIRLMAYEMPLSWITLILGFFISILMARGTALSDLLKVRALALDKSNQDLKKEISDHLQTEQTKKTLEKALQQGQKLQAIGTLAGGIAHDFNNILYAIRGYVELAREDVPKEGVTYKNLGRVLEGTHRGQELIAQILAFSRRQQHEFTPLELKREIEGTLILLHAAVPESVDIQFESTTNGLIMGNKTQIHQVIVNLINNAVDAMDSEGTIVIKLSRIAADQTMLQKIPQFSTDNYCKIEVSDTGFGMDQQTMERIFEPFYTTKEVGRGTGLGLSIVHSIVKDHKGEIIVNSQIGKGSTFTIFFPELAQSQEDRKDG